MASPDEAFLLQGISAMGGYCGYHHHQPSRSDVLDPDTKLWLNSDSQWNLVAPADIRTYRAFTDVTGSAYVTSDNTVYCTGGFDGAVYMASCQAQDMDHDVQMGWETIPTMTANRAGHALVESSQKLFAIGGYNQETGYLRSVECLDLTKESSEQAWVECAQMHVARWGCAAVTLPDSRVLVAGGRNVPGSAWAIPLDSVEIYYPDMDRWDLLQTHVSMPVPRQSFGLCWADNYVYAIGGQMVAAAGYEATRLVHRLDLESEKWEEVAPMSTARTGLAAIAYGKGILVTGGSHDGQLALESAEFLDLSSDEPIWKDMAPMPCPRWGHSLVPVDFGLRFLSRNRAVCRHMRDQLSQWWHANRSLAFQHAVITLASGILNRHVEERTDQDAFHTGIVSRNS